MKLHYCKTLRFENIVKEDHYNLTKVQVEHRERNYDAMHCVEPFAPAEATIFTFDEHGVGESCYRR